MTKFYYTPMVTTGSDNILTWWPEKMMVGNNMESVHKDCNLVFETEDECLLNIEKKIEKRGGKLRTERKKHLDLFREEMLHCSSEG